MHAVDRAPTLPPMALTCPDCGADVAPGAKFCPECGVRQPDRPAPSREVRKLVTVLFADVTGSTALGEQLDPEALRALMTRYFAGMRGVIERHGGTVEKFIGDAVMAVFGIPAVHEDDALRAVRAAWEIRDALAAMNDELEAERGIADPLPDRGQHGRGGGGRPGHRDHPRHRRHRQHRGEARAGGAAGRDPARAS